MLSLMAKKNKQKPPQDSKPNQEEQQQQPKEEEEEKSFEELGLDHRLSELFSRKESTSLFQYNVSQSLSF